VNRRTKEIGKNVTNPKMGWVVLLTFEVKLQLKDHHISSFFFSRIETISCIQTESNCKLRLNLVFQKIVVGFLKFGQFKI
jgi:hypothetical protein